MSTDLCRCLENKAEFQETNKTSKLLSPDSFQSGTDNEINANIKLSQLKLKEI